MNLRLLRSTPHVDIYFDSDNDWLYIDWIGELTLLAVQAACMQIAYCFLAYPYARVLNNNTQVSDISWSVAPWLIRHFMPHLRLAGVQHMAWVCSPSLPGLSMVQSVVTWLPQLAVAIFDDMEDGAYWLQRNQQASGTHYPNATRSAADQKQLAWVVQDLARKVGLVPELTATHEL